MVLLVTSSLFFALPLAVIGHEGGTVLAVLNGLRLSADPICSDPAVSRSFTCLSHTPILPYDGSRVRALPWPMASLDQQVSSVISTRVWPYLE